MNARHPIRQNARTGGFSLVELLVVVGVISTLLGMLMPALASVRTAQRRTNEMFAARQLMLAYVGYATDHADTVLPGYKPGLRARDHLGRPITGPAAARYPWRIAPYLATNLESLYLGSQRELLAEAQQTSDDEYLYTVSLSPSLGLNSTWVGGSQISGEMGFNKAFMELFGRFYVTSLAEVRHPSRLMVFTSARGEDPLVRGLGPVEGYFRTRSPRFTVADDDRWSETFDRGEDPVGFGFVSPRFGGAAVAAFADTHIDDLEQTELRDMRYWANRATTVDYALEPRD